MLLRRRHVHAADIVPRVPAGMGYTHHGELRYIPSFDISDKVRSALLRYVASDALGRSPLPLH